MKILMATMKMEIGGAETHILELARALHSRGVDVTVVSAGGVYAEQLVSDGIVHVTAPLHTRRPDQVLRAMSILRRLIRDGGFDVVHAHARIPALLCHLLCRQYRVRFVTTAHLNFHVNFLWRLLTRWGEQTVAVSDDIKQYLIDDYGVCRDNISVTINGINTDTFSPAIDPAPVMEALSLSADRHRIVCVSRMDTDRSEAALQLAAIAPKLYAYDPDIEVLLVGDGNDFARLRAAADAANAEVGHTVVRLTGARTDISVLIAAGDIFVGVSRAALEAMAVAKPVILAGNQGYLGIFTKDMFEVAYDSNFCCRGAEDTAPDLLYRDITALLSMTEEKRQALGQDGRAVICAHYSVSRMADDYLAVYDAVRPYKPFTHGDLLFCGYYGFGNMGDDSLLRAIIANLRRIDPDARMTVMSRCPDKTARMYGTHAVNRFNPFSVIRAMRHAKVLIFGGGNLLQDGSSARSLYYYTWILKTAKRCGCRIMVYANGIGPLHLEKSRRAAADALSLADIITLRERDSVHECEVLGVRCDRIRLTADPAFTLREADPSWVSGLCARYGMVNGKRYFVVALREWKKDEERRCAAMAAICDRMYEEHGLIPVFLPMHEPLDMEINRAVQLRCRCETLLLSGLTGGEMLGLLRRVEFVAAMRLHTLIYSTAVGTPAIGLAYDGKLRAFMETTGQPYMLEEPDEAAFMRYAGELLVQRDALSDALLSALDTYRAQAMQDAADALSLLRE
ncbi:MAG: polysaccharide pyruvyl transferase CsaB [Clostridia bacterium]|nr:polysaccharide pyruvyl transferase CsaB [Clostridia bacterium]